MTRERIIRIGIALAVFAGLLLVGLFKMSVVDKQIWLERSYLNRWAFRDVPTRRGDLLDRKGRLLAYDVPGFDLELRYRSFRRAHPVATAVHGGNLLTRARRGREVFRFDDPGRLPLAVRFLLDLPMSWLQRDSGAWVHADSMPEYAGDDHAIAQDLRFYVSAMVASLGSMPRSKVARILWKAVQEERECSVRELLSLELGDDWFDVEAAFGQSLAQLDALDARMATIVGIGGHAFDLWSTLEQRRESWRSWVDVELLDEFERTAVGDPDFWRWLYAQGERWTGWRDLFVRDEATRLEWITRFQRERDAAWTAVEAGDAQGEAAREEALAAVCPPLPEDSECRLPAFRDEARPRILRWRLPYRFAAWMGSLEEEHPGFLLRPSVARERTVLPGRDNLGSFASFVGKVTPYFRSDSDDARRKTPGSEAERILDRSSAEPIFDLPEAGMSQGLMLALEESTAREMRSVLRRHYSVFGRVGRSGAEAACDDILSGSPGLRFVERSKRVRERRMFGRLDVAAGSPLKLSVDVDLQLIAERIVDQQDLAQEAALVALDPVSGEVLAIAGSRRVMQRVGDTEIEVGREPSLAPVYPTFNPDIGSVAKPFVALEYLESLRRHPEFKPLSAFRSCDRFYAGGRSCDKDHGADSRDVVKAIGKSCNFFFFEAAREIRRPGLRRAYDRIGWRADPWDDPVDGADAEVWRYETGVTEANWQGGVPGLYYGASPEWDGTRAARHVELEAIGYSVGPSALFVARAYAALSTGALPEVRLIRGEGERLATGWDRRDLALVRRGLRGCVVDGTGEKIGFGQLRCWSRLYAKTGTAVVRSGRDELNNAWFACCVGLDEDASLVVVGVGYRAPWTGAQVGGRFVQQFLTELEGDSNLSPYLEAR